ncbi:hypothetical protein ACFPDQ_02185 [Pseudofrancisella aestuarii]|uniref:Lipoprotein n=1 Tax=Pseudofrancisella aestuarii TaxID=2670347 RepID=A0ABV9TAR8_9GAMM|nr:hypothetical protein [Pseudofrancisella aestuarii]
MIKRISNILLVTISLVTLVEFSCAFQIGSYSTSINNHTAHSSTETFNLGSDTSAYEYCSS